MPVNAHPEYVNAEKEYHLAQTPEEQIEKLKKMISYAPSHKGAENLRAQLKTRLKKLLEKQKRDKKSGKGKRAGIKKEDMQAVMIGPTNTGKSALLKSLTNASPKISEIEFTTKTPQIGMMNYKTVQIQLIENPSLDSDFYDKGLTNGADTILLVINDLNQIKKIETNLEKSKGKKIIVFNKIESLDKNQLRKTASTLQSKKYNFVLTSVYDQNSLEELKKKIFESFDMLRIYTKEPGKNKSDKPMILAPSSTVKDAAEKILTGFSKKVKQTKIWGPSSKFPGQKVGLKHVLKDSDVVEFKTK